MCGMFDFDSGICFSYYEKNKRIHAGVVAVVVVVVAGLLFFSHANLSVLTAVVKKKTEQYVRVLCDMQIVTIIQSKVLHAYQYKCNQIIAHIDVCVSLLFV